MTRAEREHQRYAHEAFVTMRVNGKVYEGRTTNVSRGGLCADMPAMIPMGAEVECDMQLVFDDDVKTDALRVAGRVVWCTTVDDAFQVGLVFKSLDADKAHLMSVFLKYLDSAGPTIKSPRGERPVDDRFG